MSGIDLPPLAAGSPDSIGEGTPGIPPRQSGGPAAVGERLSKEEEDEETGGFVVFAALLGADTEADAHLPAQSEPENAELPAPASLVPLRRGGTVPEPLRLLSAPTQTTAAADPVEEAETTLDQPSNLGLFQLRAIHPATGGEDRGADVSVEPQPEPEMRTMRLPPVPARDSALTERLKTLLATRGEGDVRELAATTTVGARRERTVNTLPSATAAGGHLGSWQAHATESATAAGNAPTAVGPTAHPIALDLVTALQGRLPAPSDAPSFRGISLALDSATHGAVDLDIRYGEGVLAITVRLQRELPPEEAESCRRTIVAACEEQGYQGVEVDLRHGNSRHSRHQRPGHADGLEVRLAGKEFPEEEIPAVPGGTAAHALLTSRFAGRRAVGPTGTDLAATGRPTDARLHRQGTRHGNH